MVYHLELLGLSKDFPHAAVGMNLRYRKILKLPTKYIIKNVAFLASQKYNSFIRLGNSY